MARRGAVATIACCALLGNAAAQGTPKGTPKGTPAPLACGTDAEFIENMRFIQRVCCGQLADSTILLSSKSPAAVESCATTWIPQMPCTHSVCSGAIHRVHSSCTGFLARESAMWASHAKQLADAAQRCPLPQVLMPQIAVSGQAAAKPPTKDTCAGVLVDGRGFTDFAGWKSQLTLKAPKGFAIQLDFFAFWLGKGVVLKIFDGTGNTGTPIKTYLGPSQGGGKTVEPWRGPKKNIFSVHGKPVAGKEGYLTVELEIPPALQQSKGEQPLAFAAQISCMAACTGGAEFYEHVTVMNNECCNEPSEACAQNKGKPKTCNYGCATVIRNIKRQCKAALTGPFMSMSVPLDEVLNICPAPKVGDEVGQNPHGPPLYFACGSKPCKQASGALVPAPPPPGGGSGGLFAPSVKIVESQCWAAGAVGTELTDLDNTPASLRSACSNEFAQLSTSSAQCSATCAKAFVPWWQRCGADFQKASQSGDAAIDATKLELFFTGCMNQIGNSGTIPASTMQNWLHPSLPPCGAGKTCSPCTDKDELLFDIQRWCEASISAVETAGTQKSICTKKSSQQSASCLAFFAALYKKCAWGAANAFGVTAEQVLKKHGVSQSSAFVTVAATCAPGDGMH